jgi:RecA-family ATPase
MSAVTLADLEAQDHDTNGAAPRAAKEAPSPVLPVEDSWFTTKPPPRSWLLRDPRTPKVRGVFPLGKVGQLLAEGGAGKTMALVQLAIAVATGSRWLGFSMPTDKDGEAVTGRVLLALGEEDAEESKRRFYYAAQAMGVQPPAGSVDVLPLHGIPCALIERGTEGNPVDTSFATWLRSYVKDHGPWRLIIVDPLSRFAGPDAEKDNAAATRYVQTLESLDPLWGASVLHAHHTALRARGKGAAVETTSSRGVTGITDGGRFTMTLGPERLKHDDPETQERLGEVITLAVTKSNYALKPNPVLLRRDLDHAGALVQVDDDDLATVEAARAKNKPATARQAQRDTEDADRSVREDEAVDLAVRERPGMSTRDLATAVQATARCGRERALVAVSRAADRLEVREGPRKARFYFPKEAKQ